jgi:hypothetical protein
MTYWYVFARQQVCEKNIGLPKRHLNYLSKFYLSHELLFNGDLVHESWWACLLDDSWDHGGSHGILPKQMLATSPVTCPGYKS